MHFEKCTYIQSRPWEFAPVHFSHNTANFRPIFMNIYMYVYLLYTKKYVPKNSQKIPNLAKFWIWHKTLKEQEKSILTIFHVLFILGLVFKKKRLIKSKKIYFLYNTSYIIV